MSIWSTIGSKIGSYFKKPTPPAPRAAPAKANVLNKAASSQGRGNALTQSISKAQSTQPAPAFNPSTPFGSALPANVQKAPSTPRSSGGGGGGSAPQSAAPSPLTGTPFDPNLALGGEIPTMPQATQQENAPMGAMGGMNLPAGAQFGATPMEKIGFGLDVMPIGMATKGAQLTNTFVRQMWKKKATQQALTQLESKAGKYWGLEGLDDLVQFAIKEGKEEGLQNFGKVAANTKNAGHVVSYLKKMASVAKEPKTVFYLALGALTTGAGVALGTAMFSKVMNPNTKKDLTFPYQTAIRAAIDAEDFEEAERLQTSLVEAGTIMDNYNGIAGDYSPWKYSKSEYKAFNDTLMTTKSQIESAKKEKDNDLIEQAQWEEKQQFQLDRDEAYAERQELERQHDVEMFERWADLEATKEKNWDIKIRKEQKQWEKQRAIIAARDELLRQQRITEWDAKIAEFDRQQAIFMANWEKKNKYYQEQKGSNLGFGLLQ